MDRSEINPIYFDDELVVWDKGNRDAKDDLLIFGLNN